MREIREIRESREMEMDIEKFIYARKSKGITQEELAKCLGIQKQNMSIWETQRAKIPIKYREKICQILNVQLDDLMSDELPEPVPVVKQPWHLPEPMHQELQAETLRLGQIVWADLRVEVEKVLSCFIANKELYSEALLALASGRQELPDKVIAELYVKFSKVALQMCGEKILDGIKTRKVETKITWER